MRTITAVIVHHSAGPISETVDQVRAYHRAPPPAGRGWADIAYHLYLYRLPSGVWTVAQGRSFEVAGAHDAGQNAGSIGVCIAGNYDLGPVDPDAWTILVATVATLCRRYQIPTAAVEGHRENEPVGTPTACPGFDPARLRAAVQLALEGVAKWA